MIKKCLLSDGIKISLNQEACFALWHVISLASEQDNQPIWGKTNLEDLNKD